MKRLAFCLATLATAASLSACSTSQVMAVAPIDGTISGVCHVDMVRGAVGLAASAQTVERARVDSDSLNVQVVSHGGGQSGATSSGQADPSQGAGQTGGDRLTVEKGSTNNITAIYCG